MASSCLVTQLRSRDNCSAPLHNALIGQYSYRGNSFLRGGFYLSLVVDLASSTFTPRSDG